MTGHGTDRVVLQPDIASFSHVMAGAARANPGYPSCLNGLPRAVQLASTLAGDRAAPTGGAKLHSIIPSQILLRRYLACRRQQDDAQTAVLSPSTTSTISQVMAGAARANPGYPNCLNGFSRAAGWQAFPPVIALRLLGAQYLQTASLTPSQATPGFSAPPRRSHF